MLAAIVLPLVTRQWQDRQNELDLKRGLVERMAEASTTAVRQDISYVEQQLPRAQAGTAADPADTYLKWLVERSVTRAVIATYFPSLEACWYNYSNAITTLLDLARTGKAFPNTRGISNALISTDADCGWSAHLPAAEKGRLDQLRKKLIRNGLLHTEATPKPLRVPRKTLQENYSDLGELLLIGKDGIVRQIVATPARGYYHGIF